MGGARGHQGAAPGERCSPAEGTADCGDNFRRLRHASRPKFAASHLPFVGPDKAHATGLEAGDICGGCRVLPHAQVHCRCGQDRLVGRQEQGRGQIVGETIGELCQAVGGCRCNHQQIRGAGKLDVTHLGLIGEGEEVAIDLVAAQRRHRERCHERRAGFG